MLPFVSKNDSFTPKSNGSHLLRCFYVHRSLIMKLKIPILVFAHSTKFSCAAVCRTPSPLHNSWAECFISSSYNSLYLNSNPVTLVLQKGIHITTFLRGWTFLAAASYSSLWGKGMLKKRLKISPQLLSTSQDAASTEIYNWHPWMPATQMQPSLNCQFWIPDLNPPYQPLSSLTLYLTKLNSDTHYSQDAASFTQCAVL